MEVPALFTLPPWGWAMSSPPESVQRPLGSGTDPIWVSWRARDTMRIARCWENSCFHVAVAPVLTVDHTRAKAPYCEPEAISRDYLKDRVTQTWPLFAGGCCCPSLAL